MAANKLIYCFFALMAGAALALELAFGGILGQNIGRLETSWLIFVVGLAAFLPYVLVFKRRTLAQLKGLRKWEYCGGLLGATYLVLLLVCVTKVGVGLSMAAVNGSLGRKAGSETATMVSFLMGTVALGVVLLFRGGGGLGQLLQTPYWQWLALVWGIMFVFFVVLAVPKIGVVLTTVLVIVGQLSVSMVVDHFGLFGNAVIPFGGKRLVGVLLMLAALYFIFRAKRKN